MRLRWPGRTARRKRLAWLALAALLFQQLGMAALACEIVTLPEPPMSMMTGCEEMPSHDPGVDAACERSCSPDTSAASDTRTGQVPPLALPGPYPAFDPALAGPSGNACIDIPARAAGPPPTLLFCSLLI